ncbi:M4 family metallopeptidase [Candidatus Protochlamydia sp. W-9]|uniref:M4 family metallopeptidase n=1 Tax=Candidatus Protochlamydia sp. W-9 TaxID=1785087 RepID=UPI00096ABAB6|nr:M4 family metallopeptidase [Candidatus Protochlamydia sp. W-9]
MGANLSETYNNFSPYQATLALSYSEKEFLQKNDQIFACRTPQETKLCRKIQQTVEIVKKFYWDTFKLVDIDEERIIPPLFSYYPKKNAYYASKLKHFAFNNEFASQPDMVCHEMTHAVFKHNNPLEYEGESGALDEAIADVVTIEFKQKVGLIDNLWKISNFCDLSTEPEPFKPANTYTNENDYGHVHQNSWIISHTFYLASKYLSHNSIDCNELFKVWFKSMLDLEDKSFSGFREMTIKVARKIFFHRREFVKEAIIDAWDQTSPLFPKGRSKFPNLNYPGNI